MEGKLNGLALFAGIGGLELGLRDYARTVCYIERELYCIEILKVRIAENRLDNAPIWDDITTFDGHPWRGVVDIITGGFPCQDVSVAGRGKGLEGARSGLWFEMFRLVSEIRPRFVFVENVPGLLGRGFGRVLGDLASIGYDAEWLCLEAAEVGAPHRRKRVFILAHASGLRCDTGGAEQPLQGIGKYCETSPRKVANTECDRLEKSGNSGIQERQGDTATDANWWAVEPDVGRVANGVFSRVDRLKALGNAVVPLQAKTAFEILMERIAL